ncbi:RHS repeat protein, partial [Variovorax sp. MHTC-1]
MKNQRPSSAMLRSRARRWSGAWIGRLVCALLVQLFLLGSAHATFPATGTWVTYSLSYPFHVVWGPGLMPDAGACVATFDAWNAEINANPDLYYIVGVEYVGFSNSYPWVCSYNSIRPDGTKQPGTYSIRPAGNICPTGSTLTSGAYCMCNAGYVEEGNGCIVPKFGGALSCRVDGFQKGHPILPATAEKYRAELDWSDRGPAPLSFERYHRSRWSTGSSGPQAGMGQTWSHSHHFSLSITSDGNLTTATVAAPNGETQTFTKPSGASTWSANNTADTLVELGPNALAYKRASDDVTFNFDGVGKLQSRAERNGWVTVYAYDAAGRLATVANPFGRSLTFVHNGAGQLTGITTPDARTISFGYDAQGRLASVQYPDGKSRSFVYENASFPQALTGILDESGARWGTFAYDSFGRAVTTELNGGVQRYQVSYGSPGTATVTDPLGTGRTYRYGFNASKIVVTSGGLTSGEDEVDAKTRAQDANGLVTSETDFKNVRTDTGWDTARRLPTSVTRAVGTPEAQTITTQWHASFGLPALITEAGRTTAFSYDGQGNLTSKTVTDRNSPPNTARTWQWAYNAQGLVVTETAPNGAVTSHEYDTSGNVTKSTNALGHASLYGYDSANRLVTQTEANGLSTTYTWDARDRMLTRTIGAGTSG